MIHNAVSPMCAIGILIEVREENNMLGLMDKEQQLAVSVTYELIELILRMVL